MRRNQVFFILANTSKLKQNKKNPEHPFGKQETRAKFQQKILYSITVRACQSFQFFRQNTWFLENNRVLSNFLNGILHYLISVTKLWKKSVRKIQFYINHASHLNTDLLCKKFTFHVHEKISRIFSWFVQLFGEILPVTKYCILFAYYR